MPPLSDAHHETFAQARFAGKSIEEAYAAAGFTGQKTSASKFNRLPEIRERLAELHREAAAETTYEKTHAVHDLLAIIHACPADAGADNPLCEPRMSKDGTCYRFPPKLHAMARLIKLMGWDKCVVTKVEPVDTLREWLIKERQHDPFKSLAPEPSPSETRQSDGQSQEGDLAPTLEPDSAPKTTANDGQPWAPTANSPLSPRQEPSGARQIAAGDPKGSAGGSNQSANQPPLSARQESFANSRVKGLGIMSAYHAAGYTGDTPNLAWRLNSMPAVQARIAELNGTVEVATGYAKDDAIRDLAAIIRSRPEQASSDHPLCEERVSAWGSYHRFPSKLGAIALLIRMLGWRQPLQEPPPRDTLQEWLAKVRARS
jgi:hypothetical protein